MKIIYHCYGGAHSSVTAAAIHLGWLPTDRLPETEDLKKIPYFDRPTAEDHGHIRFMGDDQYGNEVFVVGRRNVSSIFEKMAKGLVDIYRPEEKDLVFFDVMPYVNWMMVLGGFISRKLGIALIGRPVIMAGVLHSYWQIVSFVQRVKVCTASNNRENRNNPIYMDSPRDNIRTAN